MIFRGYNVVFGLEFCESFFNINLVLGNFKKICSWEIVVWVGSIKFRVILEIVFEILEFF